MRSQCHCGLPVTGRGLCRKHYEEAIRHGTLAQYATRARAPIGRLLALISKEPSGCWEWRGQKRKDGYGLFWLHGRQVRAHRASYDLHCGPLSATDVLCHTCDNRACVNPNHMFVGSRADNIRDCVSKDRNQFGERHWSAKLSVDAVRTIRSDQEHSCSELGKRFNVDPSVISRIKTGRAWAQAVRVADSI